MDIEPINPIDEAQMKHELRELYKDVGEIGATQALYEMLVTANMLCEVILEEREHEEN